MEKMWTGSIIHVYLSHDTINTMAEKRTMTLNLTDAEMAALEDLAAKKDLNKTVVIRQALRLYQMVDQRLREGKKVFIEDEMTKSKSELMLL